MGNSWFLLKKINAKGKVVFIPFSHICKQWGMKAFRLLSEFFFPCFHLKMCFLTTEEEKNVQKLCFYFWAPTQGTFVQSGWPQGGAHGTACSVSSLPLNLPEFQRRRKFNSKHSASSHPPQAVSAGIWHRNEWNRTTSGKVTRTRGQVG